MCALSATNSDFQLAAAKAWTNWEMATSYLVVNEDSIKRGNNERFALVNYYPVLVILDFDCLLSCSEAQGCYHTFW